MIRRPWHLMISEDTAARIARRYKAGETLKSIARTIGVSPSTIAKIVASNGVKIRPRAPVPQPIEALPFVDMQRSALEAQNRAFVEALKPVIAKCFPGARL